MTAFKFYTRTTFTPGTDTLDAITLSSDPLSIVEHEDTHRYLYTMIANRGLVDLSDVNDAALAGGRFMQYDSVSSKFVFNSMSGDGSLDASGALTVAGIGGKIVTLAGGFITSGAYTLTLTTTATTNVTFPTSGTLLNNVLSANYLYVGGAAGAVAVTPNNASSDVWINYSTGNLSIQAGVITNTTVHATAGIAFSKMASLTASRALVTDGSGIVSVSSVTSTQLGYLSGVTSAIQTQFSNILDGTTNFTKLDVDNITIDGNTISSTNTNGNINLTPNGSGSVFVDSISVNAETLSSNELIIDCGTSIMLGSVPTKMIGVFGISPVVQQGAVGGASGHVATGGTAVTDTDTFVGGVGATAYTIGDVIGALKTYGWLTQ